MAVILKPRRSNTVGAVPTTAQLADGELAINTADKIIYQRVGAAIVAVASYGGSSGVAWGGITGSLTSQTDLVAALGGKADLSGAAFTGGISGVGAVAATGTLGILTFDNRSGTARTYGWYATANIIRLWNNVSGDLLTVTEAGKLTTVGDIESSGTAFYGDGKNCVQFSDAWLRFNEGNNFTNGIYLNTGLVRSDGSLQVGTTNANGFFTSTAVAPQWQALELGYRHIPMTLKNAAYTLTAADLGKGIYHNDTTARAYTVPTGLVPAGQAGIITIANETGTGACTIVPGTGMTMYLAGTATTGTRTLAVRGIATIYISPSGTSCYVSGPGVT